MLVAARERDPELAVYLRVAALTGARPGEMCGSCWGDFDFSEYDRDRYPTPNQSQRICLSTHRASLTGMMKQFHGSQHTWNSPSAVG